MTKLKRLRFVRFGIALRSWESVLCKHGAIKSNRLDRIVPLALLVSFAARLSIRR